MQIICTVYTNNTHYLQIISLILAINTILAFTPVFAENAVFDAEYANYVSNIAPTESEKQRARDTFDGYIEDISTFPVSMTIGGVEYIGFGKDFTLKNTEKSCLNVIIK